MKKAIVLFVLICVCTINAQTSTPVLFHQNVADYEVYPRSIAYYNGEIYIPDFSNNRILKTSATSSNAVVIEVLTNIQFPSSLTIIGDELFFLQSITTPNPTNNSGKLSKIDLTQTNPSVVDVLTGLNLPLVLAGNANALFITEIIGNFSSNDFDDFNIQSTSISKIDLTGTPSKTVLLQNREFILDIKWGDSNLYWLEEFDDSDEIIKYQTNGPSVPPETIYTFNYNEDDEFAERLFIYNDQLLYTSAEFDGIVEYGRVKSIDLNNSQNVSEVSTPFVFASNEVYATAMTIHNNELFVSATSYNFNTGNENELLYTVDISTLSTQEINEPDFGISFYPNPAEFQIEFNRELEELSVFDLAGKQVAFFEERSTTFNVSKLSEGIYILKGRTTDNKFLHQKLIKK